MPAKKKAAASKKGGAKGISLYIIILFTNRKE